MKSFIKSVQSRLTFIFTKYLRTRIWNDTELDLIWRQTGGGDRREEEEIFPAVVNIGGWKLAGRGLSDEMIRQDCLRLLQKFGWRWRHEHLDSINDDAFSLTKVGVWKQFLDWGLESHIIGSVVLWQLGTEIFATNRWSIASWSGRPNWLRTNQRLNLTFPFVLLELRNFSSVVIFHFWGNFPPHDSQLDNFQHLQPQDDINIDVLDQLRQEQLEFVKFVFVICLQQVSNILQSLT